MEGSKTVSYHERWFPIQRTCNTPSFPTILDYGGLGQNTLETNLIVSAYFYHKPKEAATTGVLEQKVF